MKRIVSVLLALLLCLSAMPVALAAEQPTFTDVYDTDWYVQDVAYNYLLDLMQGTGSGKFGPNDKLTRGQLVTILHRIEGSPATEEDLIFTDVPPTAYYANGVKWAKENSIVSGYSPEKFGPGDNITREQMATIMYRYAAYKGISTTARADLSKFSDNGKISGYAKEALSWANAAGLISGTSSTTLAPTGTASRAQAAAILHRFSEGQLGITAEGSTKTFVAATKPVVTPDYDAIIEQLSTELAAMDRATMLVQDEKWRALVDALTQKEYARLVAYGNSLGYTTSELGDPVYYHLYYEARPGYSTPGEDHTPQAEYDITFHKGIYDIGFTFVASADWDLFGVHTGYTAVQVVVRENGSRIYSQILFDGNYRTFYEKMEQYA